MPSTQPDRLFRLNRLCKAVASRCHENVLCRAPHATSFVATCWQQCTSQLHVLLQGSNGDNHCRAGACATSWLACRRARAWWCSCRPCMRSSCEPRWHASQASKLLRSPWQILKKKAEALGHLTDGAAGRCTGRSKGASTALYQQPRCRQELDHISKGLLQGRQHSCQ